jgi:hypothetical protein
MYGVCKRENANSSERKRREGGDLLDDLMQGNVSLIVTPKLWPLRATVIERERGVDAKPLGPAAKRPRRRGKREGRSDCTARTCDGCPGYEAGHRVPCQSCDATSCTSPSPGPLALARVLDQHVSSPLHANLGTVEA